MSRDIFVQDIPDGISEVRDIPDGWMPEPLPYSHAEIVAAIGRVVPRADFSDPEWGHIEAEDYSIEVSIAREEPMRSFAFHVRAAGWGADHVVADILDELGLQAFDPDNDTGLFQRPVLSLEDPRTDPTV